MYNIILIVIISIIAYIIYKDKIVKGTKSNIVKCTDPNCFSLVNQRDISSKCNSLCTEKLNTNSLEYVKNLDGSIDCNCNVTPDSKIITGKNIKSVEGKIENLTNTLANNFNEIKKTQYKRYEDLIFGRN